MAHVPVAVATVEPKSPRPMDSMAGNTAVRRDKARENQRPEGRSFADKLKEAGGPAAEGKTKAGKSTADPKAEGRPGSAVQRKGSFRLKGNKADTGKLPVSSVEIRRSALPVVGDRKQGLDDALEIQTDEAEALDPVLLNHPSQSGKLAIRRPTVSEKGNSRVRRSTAAESLKPSKSPRTGNLSGSAPRVEIVDRRDQNLKQGNDSPERGTVTRKARQSGSALRQNRSGEPFSMDNRMVSAETEIEITPRVDGKVSERSAAAELARKLDAQAGNDIVRQVKVVLNRSDSGEVQINLRPDNLGRVRVRIQLIDNRLTGRIFVESAAAHEAFRNTLDGLQARLVESGFGAADLELAWDDSAGAFAGNDRHPEKKDRGTNEAAREFENMIPTTAVDDTADGRVNMVV